MTTTGTRTPEDVDTPRVRINPRIRERRIEVQREAGRRYQRSRHGRINHAARARRHRARKNNVTHQGSAPDRSDGLLSEDQAVAATAQMSKDGANRPRWHCHYCGRRCPQFVRRNFLQRSRGPWSPSRSTSP